MGDLPVTVAPPAAGGTEANPFVLLACFMLLEGIFTPVLYVMYGLSICLPYAFMKNKHVI